MKLDSDLKEVQEYNSFSFENTIISYPPILPTQMDPVVVPKINGHIDHHEPQNVGNEVVIADIAPECDNVE